jgi:hypothetical protein
MGAPIDPSIPTIYADQQTKQRAQLQAKLDEKAKERTGEIVDGHRDELFSTDAVKPSAMGAGYRSSGRALRINRDGIAHASEISAPWAAAQHAAEAAGRTRCRNICMVSVRVHLSEASMVGFMSAAA